MGMCNSCGGIIGRDCYSPQECEQISRSMEVQHYNDQAVSELFDEIAKLKQRLEKIEGFLVI